MLPSVDPAAKGAQHAAFGGRARQPRPTVKTGGLLVTTTEHAAELTIPAAPTRAAPVVRRLESTGFMNNVLRLRPKVAKPAPAPEALELGKFLDLLGVQDKQSLQDVCACMTLSESVYKAVDMGGELAQQAIQKLQGMMPLGAPLRNVSWSPPSQRQRYVVAESDDALYVAFLGTKHAKDHVANLDLRHVPLPGVAGGAGGARAHGGYLRRAEGIPLEQLYQLAAVQGKRLVLTGHSLGGAVAALCALRLLGKLPVALHSTVACVGFATPPIGNQELAEAVERMGWEDRIRNYMLPEDWVPGVLTFWTGPPRQLRRVASAPDGLALASSESSLSMSSESSSSEDEEALSAGPLSPMSHSKSAPALLGAADERVCWGSADQRVCWGSADRLVCWQPWPRRFRSAPYGAPLTAAVSCAAAAALVGLGHSARAAAAA